MSVGHGSAPAPPLGLLFRLARRFMRGRSLIGSTWLMGAVGAVIVASFTLLSSLTLSDTQVAERDLGRFEFSSDLTNLVDLTPANAALVAEIEAAASAAGADRPMVLLSSPDVEPARTNPPLTWLFETDWASDPFPDRYALTEGRWPERPGEVVLTRTSDGTLASPGEELAVLAGHERYQVVGLADDRYGDDHAILASPGTFAGIGEAALRSFPHLAATTRLLWDGTQRGPVLDRLSTGLAALLDRPQNDVAQVLEAFSQDRAQAGRAQGRPWIERLPGGYAIPALLLPVTAALTGFGLAGRRLRRSGDLLVAVGVPPARAAVALGLATTGWLAVALTVGIGVGIAIGLAGRLGIAQSGEWAQPLSPLPDPIDPTVRLLAAAIAAGLLGTVTLRSVLAAGQRGRAPAAQAQAERPAEPAHRRHATDIRHVLAALAACAAMVQASLLHGTAGAMVLAGTVAVAVLLMVPELVGWALRAVPRTDPRARLARQHLAHDRLRGAIAVTVLAAALGLPLGYLTLLDTMIRTADEGLVPDVAPGQLLANGLGGSFHPPPPAVLETVGDRLGPDRPPVQLRYLGQAGQVSVEVSGSGYGAVLALGTGDDVGRLLGRPLDPDERAILDDGGLLAWDERSEPERVLDIYQAGTSTPSERVRLPALVTDDVPPAWQRGNTGVVLTATAERLGVPVSDGGVVFTDVPDAEARAARQAVLDAGLDLSLVRLYERPELFVPQALFVAVAGLLLTVLLCSVGLARAQVQTMRRYLGTLVAIGLTPAWARQVVLIQSAFIAVVGIVAALALAIPPVVIAAWRLPGFVLSVPWGVLGLVVAACAVAVLAAAMLSCTQIRASDRTAA